MSWRPVASSPVLFNIFINDLEEGIQSTLSKFVDAILGGVADRQDVCDTFQRDLGGLGSWVEMNLMRVQQRQAYSPMHGEE